jgi:hypothetical protein
MLGNARETVETVVHEDQELDGIDRGGQLLQEFSLSIETTLNEREFRAPRH